jgi:PAS domain S-box-containing protein
MENMQMFNNNFLKTNTAVFYKNFDEIKPIFDLYFSDLLLNNEKLIFIGEEKSRLFKSLFQTTPENIDFINPFLQNFLNHQELIACLKNKGLDEKKQVIIIQDAKTIFYFFKNESSLLKYENEIAKLSNSFKLRFLSFYPQTFLEAETFLAVVNLYKTLLFNGKLIKNINIEKLSEECNIILDLLIANEKEKNLSLLKFPKTNPNPVIRISDEGKILFANDASKLILEYICDMTKTAVKAKWIKFLKKVGKSENAVYENIKCRDIVYSAAFTPVSDEKYFNVYCLDITNHIKDKEELEENKKKLETIFNNAPIGMAVVDNSGNLILSNKELETFLGYKTEEFQKMSVAEFAHIDDVEKELYLYYKLLEGKIDTFTAEKKFIKKNGDFVWGDLTVNSVKGENNRVKYIIAMVENIDERVKIREALVKSQKRYKDLFSTMLSAFAFHKVIYEDGKGVDYVFIEVNPAFEMFTGLKRKEILGKKVSEVIQGIESSWIEKYTNVADTLIPIHFEEYSEALDKHYEIYAYAPEKGYFATIFNDISKRKKSEEELQKALKASEEANLYKNEFVANMSHEIRTPLTAIIGFNQLMLSDKNLTQDQKDNLNLVIKSGQRLMNLLNDILEISKIETNKLSITKSSFSIKELCEDISSLFSLKIKEKQIIFNVYTNKTDIIYTDPLRLNQILVNLIGNAIKFTGDGFVELKVEKKYKKYLFSISDSGIGIEEKLKDKIFESFVMGEKGLRKQYEGTGLGLSISKRLVEALGGKIWFESKNNKGSTFYFTVPDKNADALPAEENSPIKEEKQVEKMNADIFIVDDERIILEYLKKLVLKTTPYNPVIFQNPKEMLDSIKSGVKCDLILLDIRMPEISGVECVKIIKETRKDIPVFALTAFAAEGDKEHLLKQGFDDYIKKPVNPEELIGKINDIVK